MSYTVSPDIKTALDSLLNQQKVAKALAWAEQDQNRCIAEQQELTAVEAPTFHEEQRAALFAQKMQEVGLSNVEIDGGGNVIGVRKGAGNGPSILLEAHMDTVFPFGSVPSVELKEDGFLYGPGVSDNTRGLAMILSVVRALDASGIQTHGDLILAGTTREEGRGGMEGVKALFKERRGAIDASISIDSGRMANIIYEATGLRTVEVNFYGVGGHAYGAFGKVANCLHAAARAAAKIADFQVPAEPRTTFCVSNIHGGNQAGVHAIPQQATIIINYRSNSPEVLADLDQRIFNAIREACDEETKRWGQDVITWDSKLYCDIPAGTQDIHSPIIEGLHSVIGSLGLTPVFLRGGATNCSIAIAEGIPAVCMSSYYSPDGVEYNTMDHTLAEKYPVAGAYKGVQAALLTALLCTGAEGLPSILRP